MSFVSVGPELLSAATGDLGVLVCDCWPEALRDGLICGANNYGAQEEASQQILSS